MPFRNFSEGSYEVEKFLPYYTALYSAN